MRFQSDLLLALKDLGKQCWVLAGAFGSFTFGPLLRALMCSHNRAIFFPHNEGSHI